MCVKFVKCMIPIQVEVRLNLFNVNCHLSQKMEKMAPHLATGHLDSADCLSVLIRVEDHV